MSAWSEGAASTLGRLYGWRASGLLGVPSQSHGPTRVECGPQSQAEKATFGIVQPDCRQADAPKFA